MLVASIGHLLCIMRPQPREKVQDRSRISLLEPHEVQYWADKFNVSKERLSEAVRNVGHSPAAVEEELKKLA